MLLKHFVLFLQLSIEAQYRVQVIGPYVLADFTAVAFIVARSESIPMRVAIHKVVTMMVPFELIAILILLQRPHFIAILHLLCRSKNSLLHRRRSIIRRVHIRTRKVVLVFTGILYRILLRLYSLLLHLVLVRENILRPVSYQILSRVLVCSIYCLRYEFVLFVKDYVCGLV